MSDLQAMLARAKAEPVSPICEETPKQQTVTITDLTVDPPRTWSYTRKVTRRQRVWWENWQRRYWAER